MNLQKQLFWTIKSVNFESILNLERSKGNLDTEVNAQIKI